MEGGVAHRSPNATVWPTVVARLGQIHLEHLRRWAKVHGSRPPKLQTAARRVSIFPKVDILVWNRPSLTKRTTDPPARGSVSHPRNRPWYVGWSRATTDRFFGRCHCSHSFGGTTTTGPADLTLVPLRVDTLCDRLIADIAPRELA